MQTQQVSERVEMRDRPIGLPDVITSAHYGVKCAGCGANFDALAAEWCHCLAAEATLVCPSCDTCFCKAGPSYSRQFWAAAPRGLRIARHLHATIDAVPAAHVEPGPRTRPLVLLVDDERVIRHLANHVITRLGYDVLVATNGVEGLEMARRFRPDIVLTDALMPKMDGRDMCRAIKEDPETAHIKVLLMTALFTSVRYQNEGFKTYKVDGYLSKPFDPVQLARVLRENVPARFAG